MRDAIGGALTMEIILVFLVLVNSYLAYSVNYTRAFRVKNAIIDLIENNEGYPAGMSISCSSSATDNDFSGRLCNIVRSYGYNAKGYPNGDEKCPNGVNPGGLSDLGLCIIPHSNINGQDISNPNGRYIGVYYTVYSYINIDLPILRNFFENMPGIFRIQGDTNIIYSSGGNVLLEKAS